MPKCVFRAIPKLCFIDISELDYLSRDLHQTCTGGSKKSFGSGIDVGGGKHVVLLTYLFLVEVVLYKLSFLCQITVLVVIAKANFEIV